MDAAIKLEHLVRISLIVGIKINKIRITTFIWTTAHHFLIALAVINKYYEARNGRISIYCDACHGPVCAITYWRYIITHTEPLIIPDKSEMVIAYIES